MNTKIITALIIGIALVGLTSATSAMPTITIGSINDDTQFANPMMSVSDSSVQGICFPADDFMMEYKFKGFYNGEKVVKGVLEADPDVWFTDEQGAIALDQFAEAGAFVQISPSEGKMGQPEQKVATSTWAATSVDYEAATGASDITDISKASYMDATLKIFNPDNDEVWKNPIKVQETAEVQASATAEDAMIKGGSFAAEAGSWTDVQTEGDYIEDIYAGSYIGYSQYDWGKIQNLGGSITSEATKVYEQIKVSMLCPPCIPPCD